VPRDVPRGGGVQVDTNFEEGPPPKIWEGKKRLKFGAISDNYRFGAYVDPPKLNFSTDYISARRVCWPLKFLHALEIDQGLLAHTPGASRWALPHISSFFLSPRDLRALSADRRETLPHDR